MSCLKTDTFILCFLFYSKPTFQIALNARLTMGKMVLHVVSVYLLMVIHNTLMTAILTIMTSIGAKLPQGANIAPCILLLFCLYRFIRIRFFFRFFGFNTTTVILQLISNRFFKCYDFC